jgi:tetratricopeptide (TPR) repeat protein/predicted Ser/Thr protein kinase
MVCPHCRAENDDASVSCFSCGQALLTFASIRKGTIVAGRYEVESPLGKGGMGMVFKAHDQVLDETVALKVLRSDVAGEPDMARRFRQEIKLARKVRHRNVCGIHEYGEQDGLRYIAMEYIEGVDLRRILQASGPPLPEEAFEIAIQLCEGLQAIHEAGIIHRDLKTPNIMRDALGHVRLMDFGIAKQAGSEATLSGTAMGMIIGTPEYMSPEQARGEKLDFRSDIYALGIVVFEIFTGHVPFQGETPIATIFKQIQEPPPLDDPRVPGALLPVIQKALAKDRDERYSSAAELLVGLRQARDETFPYSRPVPTLRAVVSGGALPKDVPRTTPVPTAVPTAVKTGRVPTVPARKSSAVELERQRARDEQAKALAQAAASIEDLIRAGRLEEAERALGRALGLHGEAEALAGMAERLEAAKTEARREGAASSVSAAREHLAAGRLSEANLAYEEAARLDPGREDLKPLSEALEAARAAWEAARLEGEERARAAAELVSQASARVSARDHRGALDLLHRARALNPESRDVAVLSGRAEGLERALVSLLARIGSDLSNGRLDEAGKGLFEARRLYGEVAELPALDRRLEDEKARARRVASERQLAKARQLLGRGQLGDAEAVLREALALDGETPGLPALAAELERAREKLHAAQKDAEARERAFAEALRQAEARLDGGDPRGALQALAEAEALGPGNRRVASLVKRAQEAARRQEEDDRKAALEPLLAEAGSLLGAGRHDEALSVIARAQQIDPRDKRLQKFAAQAESSLSQASRESERAQALVAACAEIDRLLREGSLRAAGAALGRAERAHPRAEPLTPLRERLAELERQTQKTQTHKAHERPVSPRPGGPSPLVLLGGLAVIVVVAIGIVLALRTGSKPLPSPPAVEASPVPSTIAAPTPAPSVAPPSVAPGAPPTGSVVVDALPWAEITEIRDAKGHARALESSRFTPVVLTLPAGDYTIFLRNPSAPKPVSLTVSVKPAQVQARLADFGRVDAREYLKRVGF